MSLSSYIFIILFLPITLLIYFLLGSNKRNELANTFLLIASVVFYIYCDYKCFVVLLVLAFINFFTCKRILADNNVKNSRKILFTIAILLNVSTLFIFKYLNFFGDAICAILKKDVVHINLILPLGISFFIFQQISVLADTYNGEVENICSIKNYLLYSFFFPTITSGPITYYNELVPQIADNDNKHINYDNMLKGLYLFSLGLAKKVILAQPLSNAVQTGYDAIFSLGFTNAVIMMLSYTLQIYFDFSGYSDMALGVAKMFNINLPINFNSPYKSLNIRDFWSRWHITLTRFLTKYIYIPLGGNKKGIIRTYINILIVFFISGIWHGAGLSFVVWGIMHGVFSIIYRIFKKIIDKWHPAFAWFVNFLFINLAWIYFRAETMALGNTLISRIIQKKMDFIDNINVFIADCFNIPEISFIYKSITGHPIGSVYPNLMMVLWLVISLYIVLCTENNMKILDSNFVYKKRYSIYSILLIVWALLSLSGVSVFIYSGF